MPYRAINTEETPRGQSAGGQSPPPPPSGSDPSPLGPSPTIGAMATESALIGPENGSGRPGPTGGGGEVTGGGG